jgi:hypothetical protein
MKVDGRIPQQYDNPALSCDENCGHLRDKTYFTYIACVSKTYV